MIEERKRRIQQEAYEKGLFKVKLKDVADELKKEYNIKHPDKPITAEIHAKIFKFVGNAKDEGVIIEFKNGSIKFSLRLDCPFSAKFGCDDIKPYLKGGCIVDELVIDIPPTVSAMQKPSFYNAVMHCVE